MVLKSVAFVAFAALAGCGQSLFDNNVSGDGTGPDGGNGSGDDGNTGVPSSCPAPCLADAAGDYPDGGTRWKYLDDHRNRTWTEMTASSGAHSSTTGNSVRACESGVAACTALPGALLVTTAGATSTADPALAYSAATNQVVQLTLRVHVPEGAAQHQVRLYRNSREDVLFTASATTGTTFERAITVDALAGDRFLIALVPMADGAADIGLHLYVNDTGMSFPQQCQLAVGFESATGNTVGNACGAVVTYREWDDPNNMSFEVAPALVAGPFTELGMAADIPMPRYYLAADTIVRSGDTTTQLWVRHDAFESGYAATPFSDIDLDVPGGIQIGLFDASGTKTLEVATCTVSTMTELDFDFAQAPWPADAGWHFVRVVHTNGQVRICIDGVRVGSFAAAAGKLQSTYAPRFGRNVVWTPTGAFFDGGVDDVRSFSTALPCD